MKINLLLVTYVLTVATSLNAQTFEWAKSIGGVVDDIGQSICVDALGNVYTTGSFKATVDFDPGAGTVNLTTIGSRAAFVQKLDSSGNFLWAKSFGGTSSNSGISISVDALGNVYTGGFFGGTTDFDPGTGTANLTATGTGDVFVQKLDSSGNFIWAKSFGGWSMTRCNSISVDALGNVYTGGFFEGTTDFDPSAGTTNLTSLGNSDFFVHKLDSSGNFLWAKSFGGTWYDVIQSISVDALGNVYSTGNYGGTIDFDPGVGITNLTSTGAGDVFVHKLDSSGNFLWAKSFGGTLDDAGRSISVDAFGHVYTTGHFGRTVNFDPGAGTAYLTSAGNYDVFVQKLDATGNFIWAKSFGGKSYEVGHAITVDAAGDIYTTGYVRDTADFDPGPGTTNLTSAGQEDVFVQKLDSSGNFLWARSFGGTSVDFSHSIATDAFGNVYTTGYFIGTSNFDPGAGTTNLVSVRAG